MKWSVTLLGFVAVMLLACSGNGPGKGNDNPVRDNNVPVIVPGSPSAK